MKHIIHLLIISIYIDHLNKLLKKYYYNIFSTFENNTREIYSFINFLTKNESVIFPTLPNLILCYNSSFFS